MIPDNSHTDSSLDHEIRNLINEAKAKGLIVFCGAGISANSGLPVAGMLIDTLLTVLGADEFEKQAYFRSPLPFEAVMEIVQRFAPLDFLSDIFGIGEPSNHHFLIAHLMVSGLLSTVVTTNFDRLIERALDQLGWKEGDQYDLLCRDSDFSHIAWEIDRPRLIKIHGSIHNPDQMAVTIRSVASKQISMPRGSVIKRIFSGQHTVLILGYSVSDVFDIVPFIHAIENPQTKVVLVQHQVDLSDQICRTPLETLQIKDNPFKHFRDSYELQVSTDLLTERIWKKALSSPYSSAAEAPQLWLQSFTHWKTQWSPNEALTRFNLVLGTLFFEIKSRDQAIRRFKNALEVAKKAGFSQYEAHAQMELGALIPNVEYVELALELARKLKDRALQAHCMFYLAYQYFYLGQKRQGRIACELGIKAARAAADRPREAELIKVRGNIHRKYRQYRRALRRYQEALGIAHEYGMLELEATLLYDIGLCEERLWRLEAGKGHKIEGMKILRTYFGDNHPQVVRWSQPGYNPE